MYESERMHQSSAVAPGRVKDRFLCNLALPCANSAGRSETPGCECPRCARYRGAAKRAAPRAGESLGDLSPEVAKEWHPTFNGTLTAFAVPPRSGKKVSWQCACGHEWQACIADRRYGKGVKAAKDRAREAFVLTNLLARHPSRMTSRFGPKSQ